MTMLRWRPMDGWEQERPTSARKLTYDDFCGFPDDGRRHELIEGEHYVTPSPATVHQRLVGRLQAALHAYLEGRECGEVFTAPFDVVLSMHDVVEPDLLVVLDDQQDILTDRNVQGAPALVVEILSPGTRRRDETLKRRLYERAGVREYWMVDPDGEAVTVCRQAGRGRLDTAAELTKAAGDTLTSPLLPGFELKGSYLFSTGCR